MKMTADKFTLYDNKYIGKHQTTHDLHWSYTATQPTATTPHNSSARNVI